MTIDIPIVPRGEVHTLSLCMDRIYQAERRNDEIAIANEHKAPELMAFFNRAYIDATEFSNALAAEVTRAQKVADRRKATVILDEVPKILKEKGLVATGSAKVSGTVLQQEAILTQDEQYQEAADLVDQLEHYKDLMDRKMKSIENMYLGVRKLIGGDRLQFMPNQRLSAGAQADDVQEMSQRVQKVQELGYTPTPDLVAEVPQPRGLRSSFGVPRD